MADLSANNWNEQDAANVAAAPNGMPTNSLPNALAPVVRDTRGAIKRFWNRINAIYVTTGTAAALVITFTQGPPAYVKGERFAFFPHATNTGPTTLNFNTIGAKSILRSDGTALVAGDIALGEFTEVYYDGTAFRLIGSETTSATYSGTVTAKALVGETLAGNGAALTALDASKIATGTVDDARLPATITGKTFSGSVSVTGDTTTTGKISATYAELKGDLNLLPTVGGADTAVVFRNASNAEKAVIYARPAGTLHFRLNGNATNEVYINTDGNIWSPRFSEWGSSWVFDAVRDRIESRGNAIAATRIAKTGDSMSGQLTMTDSNISFTRGNTARYIHYDSPNGNIGFLNTGGGWSCRVDNGGTVYAAANVYAGGAYLETNGNVQGDLWLQYGTGNRDAYTAIHNRIENRAQACRNDAINNIMPTIAARGAGEVGTYAFLQYDVGALGPNNGVSGAQCRWSDRDRGGDIVGYGSWRAMGRSQGAGNSTLFVRYA